MDKHILLSCNCAGKMCERKDREGNIEEEHASMVRTLIDGTEAGSMTQLSAKVIQKWADRVLRVTQYGTRAGLYFSTC